MGLFDKVFGVQQNKAQDVLSPAEAFAAITLAAIASDGYLSEQELDGLIVNLNRMRLYRSYPGDVMRRMFDKLFGILKRDGVGALFNAAKDSLPAELQESAFAVAVDLMMADGEVSREEQAFLEQLYGALQISETMATKIIEVMMIKNRG